MKKIIIAGIAMGVAIMAASQNVGIGIATPTHKLHIHGGDLFVESSSGAILFGYNSGGSQWKFITTGGGADLKWATSPDGVNFTSRHYFSQNGNVGINVGDAAPIARLEVRAAGTTSSTNTFVLRNSLGDTLMRVRDDGRIGIGYNGSSYGRLMNVGGTGINFYTANEAAFGGAIFPTDTSLVLWSNSSSNNYLVFQPSWGNTGIGTYTPNAKLHLNGAMLIGNNSQRIATGYALSVDGKIVAEEMLIKLSTEWPDYVFDEGYNLMPLEELETYLKTEKHLPNIKSASTINAQSGFEVGETSRKLLEKVEELSLYIIQLKKENKVMQERLSVMERKN